MAKTTPYSSEVRCTLFSCLICVNKAVSIFVCVLQVDDNLQKSYIYKSFRVKGSIAPLKVSLVKPGTFLEFRLSMIESQKATPNQFKVPRVLKKPEAVEFMRNHCI